MDVIKKQNKPNFKYLVLKAASIPHLGLKYLKILIIVHVSWALEAFQANKKL